LRYCACACCRATSSCVVRAAGEAATESVSGGAAANARQSAHPPLLLAAHTVSASPAAGMTQMEVDGDPLERLRASAAARAAPAQHTTAARVARATGETTAAHD
jgi:hypothetical protein